MLPVIVTFTLALTAYVIAWPFINGWVVNTRLETEVTDLRDQKRQLAKDLRDCQQNLLYAHQTLKRNGLAQ